MPSRSRTRRTSSDSAITSPLGKRIWVNPMMLENSAQPSSSSYYCSIESQPSLEQPKLVNDVVARVQCTARTFVFGSHDDESKRRFAQHLLQSLFGTIPC